MSIDAVTARIPQVLVVDDAPECAEELAELLECFDCAARPAHSIAQARAAHAARPCDVALIDLQLGPESGIDLALEWREAADSPRVILLSGRKLTEPESARFGGEAPPFVLKPADIDQLIALIRS